LRFVGQHTQIVTLCDLCDLLCHIFFLILS
jgi:hypothetical protein